MSQYGTQVLETAEFLKRYSRNAPLIGLMTGTGLGESTAKVEIDAAFAYREIPNFPVSTVESHAGRLLLGRLAEKPVIAMQGRFHLYEGYTSREVAFPVRVMQAMGVKYLILSNAAGGLNTAFSPGDLMVIADHINLTGHNPLIGPNEDGWGERFPDMSRVYDPTLAALARQVGRACGAGMQTGVYAGLIGPSLETPAEVRFLSTIGADAVGFSTVQEVICGGHAGMRILGLSTITNVHTPDSPQPASVADIIACAEGAATKMGEMIQEVIKQIDE
ncbi:MAG: purine-nucleoside phosphorylase [Desulfobacterales bacterium]|jgi:purine-nucleoside phosphorylase|nr:purine-nucleoside phosphorylase [Desulfobacterales bacterium]